MKQLKALWTSLPSWAKGCIFIGGSAASGAIKKYFETPNACLSLHCLAIVALSALHVGCIAAVGWVMQSPVGKTLLADVEQQSQSPAVK
jgi:hypothetical protein